MDLTLLLNAQPAGESPRLPSIQDLFKAPHAGHSEHRPLKKQDISWDISKLPAAASPEGRSLDCIESQKDSVLPTTSTLRPRRSTRAQAPRMPSPDEQEELDESPPPPPARVSKPKSRRMSHSAIEKRRREKINDVLAQLQSKVPHCASLLELKESRKRESEARRGGRKRKRDDDDAQEGETKGVLHKLEILEGTLEYLIALETENARLRGATIRPHPTDPKHNPYPSHSYPSPASLATQVPSASSSAAHPTPSPSGSLVTQVATRPRVFSEPPELQLPPPYMASQAEDGGDNEAAKLLLGFAAQVDGPR